MTEKVYKVEFTAHLHRLTLALKMNCDIEVIWKRGQKLSQTGKVALRGGQALFDQKISIACNMVYNSKTKIFNEKITKFLIVLTSEKGTKQAGQINFDVAQYINEKQLTKKQFDEKLQGCPDKNARLSFALSGVLKEQIGKDAISDRSRVNQDGGTSGEFPTVGSSILMKKNTAQIPTKDNAHNNSNGLSKISDKSGQKDEKVRQIEQQNDKMRRELQKMQSIKKQNDELRKKIKSQQFTKSSQIKQKIQKAKQQIQKMKADLRANKNIQQQTDRIMNDILMCKIKIMKAFNYAADYGGSKLVDKIQTYCGINSNDDD